MKGCLVVSGGNGGKVGCGCFGCEGGMSGREMPGSASGAGGLTGHTHSWQPTRLVKIMHGSTQIDKSTRGQLGRCGVCGPKNILILSFKITGKCIRGPGRVGGCRVGGGQLQNGHPCPSLTS